MRLTPSFLDGVFLAVNSLPGWLAMLDAPRCETERMFSFDHTHDWSARLCGDGSYARNRRIYAADWVGMKGVTGTEDTVRRVLGLVRHRNPGCPVLICRGLMSHIINTDLDGLAAELSTEDSPVLVVPQAGLDSDWMDGWKATHDTVWRHLLRDEGDSRFHVTGMCLFRKEGDELGNVSEIERLFDAVTLPERVWLFAGSSSQPRAISRSAPKLVFPFGRDHRDNDALVAPHPLGIEGTCKLLSVVGERFGCADRAARVVDFERDVLAKRLTPLVAKYLAGRAAYVVADRVTTPRLCQALRDIGMDIVGCAVLQRQSAECPWRSALEAEGTAVHLDPSYQEVQEELMKLGQRRDCHVVVGSAILRDAAAMVGLPYVECTAPHALEHFSAPNPYLGFEGLVRLAERLTNSMAQYEHMSQFMTPRHR